MASYIMWAAPLATINYGDLWWRKYILMNPPGDLGLLLTGDPIACMGGIRLAHFYSYDLYGAALAINVLSLTCSMSHNLILVFAP